MNEQQKEGLAQQWRDSAAKRREQGEFAEVVRDLRCVAEAGWICAAAGADLIDQLRQRLAELEKGITRRGDDVIVPYFLYQEMVDCEERIAGKWMQRAEQAEAKLALAEADNARLHRILHASADSSHKCKRCGLPYTPLEGASEDCPDCGYDGIAAIDAAIDASGESSA